MATFTITDVKDFEVVKRASKAKGNPDMDNLVDTVIDKGSVTLAIENRRGFGLSFYRSVKRLGYESEDFVIEDGASESVDGKLVRVTHGS